MKANEYLYHKIRGLDGDSFRPKEHFTAPVGWINDPNGLVYYKGWYHLFCQYNPYGAKWGTMHWYHARSKDLLNWEDLGVALMPEHDYERSGVFSGSAIVKGDRLYLLYTGHSIDPVSKKVMESQCVAWTDDGLNFEKYDKNPVLLPADGPEGQEDANFRDPKAFERDGKYYIVVAAGVSGHGEVLLFESADLLKWDYVSSLLPQTDFMGKVTECPDFFTVDGQDYLAFSTIYGEGKPSLVNLVKGKMDWEKHKFLPESQQLSDESPDFYASQSLEGKNGERIVIPWLRSVDYTDYLADTGHVWNGMMGMPRVLTVENGELVQRPIQAGQPLDHEAVLEAGTYQVTDFSADKRLLLLGYNGRIEISQADGQFEIEVLSPVGDKKYQLPARADFEITLDNSVFEMFAGSHTLSVFTFIKDIKQAVWDKK
ncbi:glycoside hydrolase family 32 protein [Lactobacillus delbrueckii]|uniref:glycoside hydrolase family 32 protein n=1 Tax=Lactobacillus delbrueckii TaxID=1584 RepID=UPI003A8C36C5